MNTCFLLAAVVVSAKFSEYWGITHHHLAYPPLLRRWRRRWQKRQRCGSGWRQTPSGRQVAWSLGASGVLSCGVLCCTGTPASCTLGAVQRFTLPPIACLLAHSLLQAEQGSGDPSQLEALRKKSELIQARKACLEPN